MANKQETEKIKTYPKRVYCWNEWKPSRVHKQYFRCICYKSRSRLTWYTMSWQQWLKRKGLHGHISKSYKEKENEKEKEE